MNKVSTKAEVRFNVDSAAWINEHTRERLRVLYASRISVEGDIIVTSQLTRSQERNLDDAVRKLSAMVHEASLVPLVRELKTGPPPEAKAQWTDDKRTRSRVKEGRRKGGRDDD